MKNKMRPLLLTLAQLVCVAVLLLTLIPALLPTLMLIDLLRNSSQLSSAAPGLDGSTILLCLRDLALGVCLICAEMEGLGVISRMKKASAISEKNEASLGRASIALGFGCVITLLFGDSIIPYLLMGLPAVHPLVERLLLPFILLGLGLMLRAVQVLMHRALSMQEENDLTV